MCSGKNSPTVIECYPFFLFTFFECQSSDDTFHAFYVHWNIYLALSTGKIFRSGLNFNLIKFADFLLPLIDINMRVNLTTCPNKFLHSEKTSRKISQKWNWFYCHIPFRSIYSFFWTCSADGQWRENLMISRLVNIIKSISQRKQNDLQQYTSNKYHKTWVNYQLLVLQNNLLLLVVNFP